jgi:eukaryotic-like serine/threonine-protein kinase
LNVGVSSPPRDRNSLLPEDERPTVRPAGSTPASETVIPAPPPTPLSQRSPFASGSYSLIDEARRRLRGEPAPQSSRFPGRVTERPSERITERPSERITERPSERTTDRPSERVPPSTPEPPPTSKRFVWPTHAPGAPPRDERASLALSGRETRYEHHVGDVIASKYELGRLLRKGGTSTVWEALERPSGRRVAIKLIRVDSVEMATSRRLLEEARILAGLSHPCVVRLLQHGASPESGPFLVLEYLSGPTFAELLQQQPEGLAPAEVVRLLLPIASALNAVHARGLLHRDVKTTNLMLETTASGDKRPKLIDFGIALRQDGPRITGQLQVLGSPKSLAPEQVLSNRKLDERVDVWGVGMVLFEMLHGFPAFPGTSLAQIAATLLSARPLDPTPLTAREPDLWAILSRALTKDVDARTRSMLSLGRELSEWAIARGVTEDIMGRSLRVQWLRT